MSGSDIVTSLDDRGHEGRPPLRCPACRSEWFHLIATSGDNAGQVTLDTNRNVTGYSGFLVCAQCGEEWQ